jgi:hypothetical protein
VRYSSTTFPDGTGFIFPLSNNFFQNPWRDWAAENALAGDTTNQALVAEQNRKNPKTMKHQLLRMALAMILAGATAARADAVLDWNAIAAQTIFAAGRPGPSVVIDLAVVQAAVHDAVQAYDKRFEPYATEISGASGSPAAAIAKATRDILVNRLPAQAGSVDTAYTNYLAANGLAADDPGVSVGAAAAAGMIALRTGDGAFPNPSPVFNGTNLVGMWRPTPSYLPGPPASGASMAIPWLADVTPFVVLSGDQFVAPPPPLLGTSLYRKEYDEVKALGALIGSSRTPEQTQIAYFWADNFPAQVNRIIRNVSETYLDSSADRARLFALVWLGATDALINTWTGKLQYPTWRPITAINQGDFDGDPKTSGDVNWQPLINTPNYPDHSSGANALVSGVMKMLALYFGTDEVTFTVTSTNPNANPNSRTYARFTDAALDVVEARILQGIHTRSADLNGRQLGKSVAKWVFKHALRPLNDGYDDDDEDDQD